MNNNYNRGNHQGQPQHQPQYRQQQVRPRSHRRRAGLRIEIVAAAFVISMAIIMIVQFFINKGGL